MLTMKSTPNHTGIKISGDYFDLDELNQSLYAVLGKENQYLGFEGSRMRILGIAYEIRHVAQGDRNIEFVFNGVHEHTKKQHGFIAPEKNIYFSVELLWPKVIYAVIALKDFLKLYQAKSEFPAWDMHVHTISHFQALVLDCLHGHIPEEEYQVVLQAFNAPVTVNGYAIQYVDLLNLKYIDMTKEQREQSLSSVALKLAVQDQDYAAFRNQVLEAASPAKKSIHEIGIQAEYPDDIKW